MNLPLAIWMMKGYFDGLPPNLEKAALVDGCSRLQALWKIVLPVARPGLVAPRCREWGVRVRLLRAAA